MLWKSPTVGSPLLPLMEMDGDEICDGFSQYKISVGGWEFEI